MNTHITTTTYNNNCTSNFGKINNKDFNFDNVAPYNGRLQIFLFISIALLFLSADINNNSYKINFRVFHMKFR